MKEGQPFVDEPIYVEPITPTRIEASVAVAFNPRWQPKRPLVVSHERVMLKWVKPEAPQ